MGRPGVGEATGHFPRDGSGRRSAAISGASHSTEGPEEETAVAKESPGTSPSQGSRRME